MGDHPIDSSPTENTPIKMKKLGRNQVKLMFQHLSQNGIVSIFKGLSNIGSERDTSFWFVLSSKQRRNLSEYFSSYQNLHYFDSFTFWSSSPYPFTSHRIWRWCWPKRGWLVNICISFIAIPIQNDPVCAGVWPTITCTSCKTGNLKKPHDSLTMSSRTKKTMKIWQGRVSKDGKLPSARVNWNEPSVCLVVTWFNRTTWRERGKGCQKTLKQRNCEMQNK